MATPGYRAVVTGPDWLTGGQWGPEGGIIATIVLLSAAVWGTQQTSFTNMFPNFMRPTTRPVAARG